MPRRRKSISARRRHQRLEGAAAVEFALVLPLFALLLLGLIDFGHFFFTMNTITNAAREGARRAVVTSDATGAQAKTMAYDGACQYLAAAGLAPGGGGANCPNNCKLNCPSIDPELVNWGGANATVSVTITINGAFKNITGFSYKVLPGSSNPFASMTNLSAVSQMRWELAPN
jgi:Flp pilus assembly protein TadG